ncbi:glycoside hydrolase family 95 protein, partial [Gelidibacter sp.]|uniref:glycoside hydrolase family 95 protein n=1 Tax=Gelidibacter sp. TaxID=2018083 RepID=UPI0032642893
EASSLTRKTQISKGVGTGGNGANIPYGSFQTLGDLWLDFDNDISFENYHRELDLEDAVVRISYTQNGVRFKREIFVSEPDQVMVVKLTADQPGKISFKGQLTRPEKFTTTASNEQLIMQGTLSDGKGGEGLQYMTRLTAVHKKGHIDYSDAGITVENADEVTLLLSASTDYLLDYPTYKGRDYKTITNANLIQSKQKSYNVLLDTHKKDYQNYYKRVSLNLTSQPDTIPTDVRLQNFKTNPSDPYLIEKLFQYGRYLLISSSRPGTLPANLQGIWTDKIQTPWNGDYHTNVNVQMNYWPAETTNLGEMHLPLFDLLASIQEPGAKTAQVHYNAKGWILHPVTNVWGYTSPGEDSSWGMHISGGAWLSTHIMEHYYFTLDKAFLEKTYPILKASAEFYIDWLIKDPETGELVSGPSSSPENTFLAPDGTRSQICMAPAHDQQVIWHLFKNYIDASTALNINDQFLTKIKAAQKELSQPKIGSDGRLMEWNEEFEEVEPGHRHISHLFALHPGYQIDVNKTPELAQAARQSLDFRIKNGGGHTGWSASWLINQYARLGDAELAKINLHKVISESLSPNLFGLHPPFQIDANFGSTAGIAEMLLQSQSDELSILPALPKDWAHGEVKGLAARGGFIVDIKWESGKLMDLKVMSKNGGICKLRYAGREMVLQTKSGMTYSPVKNGKIMDEISSSRN